MDGRLILMVTSMLLFLPIKSTAQTNPPIHMKGPCGRLIRLRLSNETGASIKLTWSIPGWNTKCENKIKGYNITYGTIGGLLKSTFVKVEDKNQTKIEHPLNNLIPETQYLIVITVNYANDSIATFKRPIYQTSGRASESHTNVSTNSTASESHRNMSTNSTASESHRNMSTNSTSVNGGAIAGGVVSFVLVVVVVIIALISVWLIKRRRKLRNRNGLHYISVVYGIGNESRTGQLHSRPGYLQIVHDSPCAGYEIPRSSINLRPETTLLANETEYPKRELHGCADSNTSINSVKVTTEPIRTSLVSGTDHHTSDAQVNKGKRKLVKPYAIVDVRDIGTDTSLKASQGVLDRLKAKHQKQEELPSNREALKKSFASCVSNSASQVDQCASTPRYYTVPMYVNLNVPMSVNPSYNKNKV